MRGPGKRKCLCWKEFYRLDRRQRGSIRTYLRTICLPGTTCCAIPPAIFDPAVRNGTWQLLECYPAWGGNLTHDFYLVAAGAFAASFGAAEVGSGFFFPDIFSTT